MDNFTLNNFLAFTVFSIGMVWAWRSTQPTRKEKIVVREKWQGMSRKKKVVVFGAIMALLWAWFSDND